MAIQFEPESHIYTSIDKTDTTKWTSVTKLIHDFVEPFDEKGIAAKVVKSKKSKWYGLKPDEVLKIWKAESDRSTILGHWYHDQREADYLACSTMNRNGNELKIISSKTNEQGIKIASDQRLDDGIYPEHMMFLKSLGWCGQSDLIEVYGGRVYVVDYKTNKEIKTQGFKGWDGRVKKMLGPLNHLDDCNYNHYNIQLSIYMYMVLKHNPHLRPGGLLIKHIIFEEEDVRDQYDYPIHQKDSDGNYIVKDITNYSMDYLLKEVIALANYYKQKNK